MSAADPIPPVLERAINEVLALDGELLQALAAFADKRIAVVVDGFEWRFCLRPGPGGVAVEEWDAGAMPSADVVIGGSVVALAALPYRAKLHADSPLPEDVRIQGDVALVQELLALVGRSQLDWEEWISRRTGDVVGHQLARGVRALIAWSGSARRQIEASCGEYLREEVQLCPDRHRVARFASEVDSLRDDVERVAQRLQRLVRDRSGPAPRGRS